MRIIAGELKGRRLRTLEGLKIRPTSDRLRETLFNILAPRISDARFLDLCAGSGAVGIEAFSRGAASVTFIESSRRAASLIEENLEHCGVAAQAQVHNRDALAALKLLSGKDAQFDIIYFDPPYESHIYSPVLELIGKTALLARGGVLVAEHRGAAILNRDYGDLRPYREVKQGDSRLTFYAHEDHSP
jgi:16S rRNA (guanine(966)-N(2))-methyltransferase RsmD